MLMSLPVGGRSLAFHYPHTPPPMTGVGQANSVLSSLSSVALSPQQRARQESAPTDDETPYMDLEKCDLKYVSYGFKNRDDFGMAVVFTAEELLPYAGCKITAINIVTPSNDLASEDKPTLVNTIKKATVSIGETLEGTPVHSFEVTLGSIGSEWQACELPSPYAVEAGKGVCFKVMYTGVTERDHPYAVDASPAQPGGAWVYSRFKSNDPVTGKSEWQEHYQWRDMTPYVGLNNCLSARIEGETLPQSKVLPLADDKGVSTIRPGEPFAYHVLFQSLGAEKVTNIEIEMEIEGGGTHRSTAVVERADPPYHNYVRYKDMGVATANFSCNREGGDIIYTARVTKVNGKPNEHDYLHVGGDLTVMQSGFTRRMVCEEYTGTWCGWCPAAMAAIGKAKEVYGDRFIPIAVHSEDEMDLTAPGAPYETFVKDMEMVYAPSAVINRMTNPFQPEPAGIVEYLSYYNGMESFMDITPTFQIDASQNTGTLAVDVTASCAAQGDYGVAYVVVEDLVGPYAQNNSFAGGAEGPMEGWEDSPEVTMTLFNDVARKGSVYRPQSNMSFSGIAKGETKHFATTVSLDGVSNVENCRIVALLINNVSQVIVNARQTSYNDFGQSSITDIASPAARGPEGLQGLIRLHSPGAIYTLQGCKVISGNAGDYSVAPGVYVVRGAWGSAKVYVN